MLAQALMEAEGADQIGAAHGERNPEGRTAQRNGYRDRPWDTRVGTVGLLIPKLRTGSYFPGVPGGPHAGGEGVVRRRGAVLRRGRVDAPCRRRRQGDGHRAISKSQVSRICAELDEVVAAWRNRPLDAGPYTFVWIDALTQEVRGAGRIVATAVLVAAAVNGDGHR